MCFIFLLFFKQKAAYEMRISDWSSDVCSSDLRQRVGLLEPPRRPRADRRRRQPEVAVARVPVLEDLLPLEGKRVLLRADFNVPVQDGRITDDLPIRAPLPARKRLPGHAPTRVAGPPLGRPQGPPNPHDHGSPTPAPP